MDKIIESLRDKKAVIIDDLFRALDCKPDRDTDLLAMMKKYIAAEPKDRPPLLSQIRACMDGEPYQAPYLLPYFKEDVFFCNTLLERFIFAMTINPDAGKRHRQIVLDQLEGLNVARGYGLLDDWRREHITEFLDAAISQLCHCVEHTTEQQMRC